MSREPHAGHGCWSDPDIERLPAVQYIPEASWGQALVGSVLRIISHHTLEPGGDGVQGMRPPPAAETGAGRHSVPSPARCVTS